MSTDERLSPLTHLVAVGDIIWELLGGQNLVFVVDTKEVLYARDGKNTRFNLKPGDPIKPQWVTSRALKAGERVVDYVSTERSTFGFPYAAMAVPVFEDGKSVGAFTVTSMLDKQEEIRTHAEQLSESAGQLTESSDHISLSATELANSTAEMEATIQEILKNVGAVEEAIDLINDVSERTHLLGLNASIEAARASDRGRGFNVVATEIQKLAAKVKESVETVSVSLNAMADGVRASAAKVGLLSSVAKDQAATMERITDTIRRLETGIGALEDISKQAWL